MRTVYETPAYKIGKTEWKMVVFEDPDCVLGPSTTGEEWFMRGIHRMTLYLYNDYGTWKPETKHPRYNPHDGTYAGLPKSLRKIYERHEIEILAALVVTDRKLRAI